MEERKYINNQISLPDLFRYHLDTHQNTGKIIKHVSNLHFIYETSSHDFLLIATLANTYLYLLGLTTSGFELIWTLLF